MSIDRDYFKPKEEDIDRHIEALQQSIILTGQINQISPMLVIKALRMIADSMEKELDEFISKVNSGEISIPNWG
jgi:hypothetical protein